MKGLYYVITLASFKGNGENLQIYKCTVGAQPMSMINVTSRCGANLKVMLSCCTVGIAFWLPEKEMKNTVYNTSLRFDGNSEQVTLHIPGYVTSTARSEHASNILI